MAANYRRNMDRQSVEHMSIVERYNKNTFLGQRKILLNSIFDNRSPAGHINILEEIDDYVDSVNIPYKEKLRWAKTKTSSEFAKRAYEGEKISTLNAEGLGPIPF